MKQEILCPACATEIRRTFPTDNPSPGEHIKFVSGNVAYRAMCDCCCDFIEQGSPCTAFSSWADYGGIPYYPWEHEFIVEAAS
jgi:hypothetical protein